MGAVQERTRLLPLCGEPLASSLSTLPQREQFNRLQRHYRDVIVAFSLFLVEHMQAQRCLYEALDSSGIPTRDAKRRGTGWLAGQADIGWSNRIGWYEGFHLLTSITPTGLSVRSCRYLDPIFRPSRKYTTNPFMCFLIRR